jgi:catechol 2,3-dioxygenase-like lactoylglutathione lyase family enzyme
MPRESTDPSASARRATVKLERIHHVAYRCRDARQTVAWYGEHLGMAFMLAIAEDRVPSTGEPDPYMHVFLDAGGGNVLAFFELPNAPEPGRDPNTPNWVQHIAFKVDSVPTLLQFKAKLQDAGIEVLGPTDHTIFQSIYFRDPNGHRIELAADVGTADMYGRLDAVKWAMLEEWSRTRKAPQHAAWMHAGEAADPD